MVEEICKKLGIKWFASVLDIKSFKFIEHFQPEVVKLPSTISQHKDLLIYVSKITEMILSFLLVIMKLTKKK